MTQARQPRKGKRGALTPEHLERLLEHLGKGLFRVNACALIGIHPTTLEAWMRKGREELADACDAMDATGRMPTLSRYGQLVVRVEAVEAEVEAKMVGVVIRVAQLVEPEVLKTVSEDGTESVVVLTPANPEAAFRAAAWYLERRRHLVYGKGALRIDLTPESPVDDESEDPVELFLDKLGSIERNVRAVTAPDSASAKPEARDDETHE